MGCSDSDYAFLREIVRDQSANRIDSSKNLLFDTRLTPIARMAGAADLRGLVGMLRAQPPEELHRAVAEAMTINETSFFRDMHPFEMLRKSILPNILRERAGSRRLRIWSAACSTGQEAYSMAMLLCEHFPELSEWDVKIVGTDISRRVLEYARRGRYRRLEVNRGLPARLLTKYMVREGEEWQLADRLRNMCEFRHTNLCGGVGQLGTFDLVLLRNVLLYFDQQDRGKVFREVHGNMAADGCLVLGTAEQAEESTKLFDVEFASSCYFYRRRAAG